MASSGSISECWGKRGISAEMAVKLSKTFGGSPLFWMNLQVNREISQIDVTAFADIKPYPLRSGSSLKVRHTLSQLTLHAVPIVP